MRCGGERKKKKNMLKKWGLFSNKNFSWENGEGSGGEDRSYFFFWISSKISKIIKNIHFRY